MGNFISAIEKVSSKWEQLFKCSLESWQSAPINVISPSMFHLNLLESGKDDSSSEAYLQSSKPIEAPILLKNYPFLSKYLDYIS
jgi:hypothetical protein